jgi:nitrogen fixation/metabolism regulation signal transduction histidine kinase
VAGDTALAVVARAPIHYQGEWVGVVEGGTVLGAATLRALRDAGSVELAIESADGRPLAATRAELGASTWLRRAVPLEIGPAPHPMIAGYASTAAADGTVRALQWTAAGLGLLGLALAILLGFLWSSQVSRPVERLAAFSDRLAQGHWEEPLAMRSVRELETLVAALDRMRTELRSYRERLKTSERQAAWSQMARQVAHEVRNPLTPIAISVADLKRSYELGRPDFPQILDQAVRTIGDEIESLRRLLQEFSDFGRLPPPNPAPMKAGDLLADLAALYPRELAEGRLAVARPEPEVRLTADAGQLRQALVNLVKNGFEAADGGGRVTVTARGERGARGALTIAVADTGPGLTEEQRAHLFTPGFTTKTHGSGLGLTIVEKIVNDHRGTIAVEPGENGGTVVRIRSPLRQPTTE